MNVMHSQGSAPRTLATLWALAPPTTRGPRPRVTVDDLTAAAVALADGAGLPGLTLSAVAGELGLTTTALYRYVESKEALVELVADVAVGEPVDLGDGAWQEQVHAWSAALLGRHLAHPWLTEVTPTGMPSTPRRLAWVDQLLHVLDRGDVRHPMQTALLLDGVTRALAPLARAAAAPPPPSWLLDAVTQRFPRLARELERPGEDVAAELATAVGTVLRGTPTGRVARPHDPGAARSA